MTLRLPRGKELSTPILSILFPLMTIFDPSPFQPNFERCLARFKREVNVLSSLQHRGIVKLIEAGQLGDRTP